MSWRQPVMSLWNEAIRLMTGIPHFLPRYGADGKAAQRRVKRGEHAPAHITCRATTRPSLPAAYHAAAHLPPYHKLTSGRAVPHLRSDLGRSSGIGALFDRQPAFLDGVARHRAALDRQRLRP